MITLLALEGDPEGILQRGTDRLKRRQITSGLDPSQCVASIGCQKPRDVLGLNESDVLREGAPKILDERAAD